MHSALRTLVRSSRGKSCHFAMIGVDESLWAKMIADAEKNLKDLRLKYAAGQLHDTVLAFFISSVFLNAC
jgi:hypothetical protein